MPDGLEHQAKTDPTDPASVFCVTRLHRGSDGLVVVWDSAPGNSYVVETFSGMVGVHAEDLLATRTVIAADAHTQFSLPMARKSDVGLIRVRLLE